MSTEPTTTAQLLERIAVGEHSRQQFKRHIRHPDALAAELVAFSNSGGGTLLIGVNDDGSIAGLDAAEVCRTNQMLSNTASQHMRPPIGLQTENVLTEQGLVILVTIADGLSKPYLDHQGRIWMRSPFASIWISTTATATTLPTCRWMPFCRTCAWVTGTN